MNSLFRLKAQIACARSYSEGAVTVNHNHVILISVTPIEYHSLGRSVPRTLTICH